MTPRAAMERLEELKAEGFTAWWDDRANKIAFRVPFMRIDQGPLGLVYTDTWDEEVQNG